MQTVPADIYSASTNYKWREDFYWPIDSRWLIDIRISLENEFIDILNACTDEKLKHILKISINLLIITIILSII